MSASRPIPEDVRRDIERMAGPLAERMLPPKVTQSSTTRNVVAAVNDDGTVDVAMGGAVMQRVPATTACVGVAVGDEVIVEQYGPRLYCVGVVAKSLDNAPYVRRLYGSGNRCIALTVVGGVGIVSFDLSETISNPTNFVYLAQLPDGVRPLLPDGIDGVYGTINGNASPTGQVIPIRTYVGSDGRIGLFAGQYTTMIEVGEVSFALDPSAYDG